MNKSQYILLPFPPSLNTAFPTGKNGRRYRSARYEEFKQDAAKWLLTQKPQIFTGELAVMMYLFRPRKRGDIDNYSKVVFDTLKGICFADDDQITDLRIIRLDDKDNPRVELLIGEKGSRR